MLKALMRSREDDSSLNCVGTAWSVKVPGKDRTRLLIKKEKR